MSITTSDRDTERDTVRLTKDAVANVKPKPAAAPTAEPRQISMRLSTVLTGLVVAVSVVAAIVFAALYFGANGDLADRDARASGNKHAEQVAMDYALGASTIDYHDTKSWQEKLKANTGQQLAAKFDATAMQLEQILLPLQWTSKATPIQAVVVSNTDGIYQVNAFLTVTSTSVQTPQGGATTIAYALTIDSNSGWKITDVGGGLTGVVPAK